MSNAMYDINAEIGILSCIINDVDLLPKVSNRIKEFFFFNTNCKKVWRAIKELYRDNKIIDVISINNWLRVETNLNEHEISNLVNEVSDLVTIAHIDMINDYIKIVVNFYQVRQMVKMSQSIIYHAENRTTFNNIKTVMSEYNVIPIQQNEYQTYLPEKVASIITNSNREDMESIEHGIKRQRGLNMGLAKLSKYVDLRPKNTYVIAGRPGHGKSSLALAIAYKLSMQNYKIAFFSLEMDRESIMEKLISMVCHISNKDFRALHEAEQIKYRKQLSTKLGDRKDNIIIDDTSYDLDTIINSIYNLHRQYDLDLVIIDFFQLITLKNFEGNENAMMTKISRAIKTDVATKLMIPAIGLSQLNRGVENRPDKRPLLSDLRSSGSFEQDATTVLSVYRPEEYGILVDKYGNSTKDKAEIGILKNRFGKKGIINTNFVSEYTYFVDDLDEINNI